MFREERKVNNGNGMTESNVIELWASKIPEVMQWLSKIQIKELNALALYRFCQWAGKTPIELLAMKKDPSSLEIEKLLDTFVAADEKTLGMTNALKFWRVNAVKSLFKHNYINIARTAGAIQLEKKKEYNKLSKGGLRKLWNWTQNPRDKCLVTFVNSTAVAKETLSQIKWKHLEENWEKVDLPCINLPPEILKGHGRGKYKGVRQTTFLTPEAKRDLIDYKEWLEQKMGRKVTPEDHVFVETYAPYRPASYDALGGQIWHLSRRAGVPFSLHDGRRWVNTALEQIAISENWARKIRGRKVRGEEAPYSQPAINQLREKFREAVPLLQFTVEPLIPKEVQEAIATHEEEIKKLKMQYGMREKRLKLEPKKQPKTETDGGNCTNGQHCQKIVSEDELPQLLANGWGFVATLQSGKIVVSND